MPSSVISHPTVAAWRLELLGGANIRGIAVQHSLERKTAGVLALLALEGEISRSKVAGLLWADTDEERARANLRQCLYRLKKLLGIDLVQANERLSLNAALEVDTVTLESRAFLGDDAGLIAVRGEILEHFDFEDCPDFMEWLMLQRERWRGARVGAFRRALQNPSKPEALEWAQEWINLEPISEEAYRALARVYYKRGNRALALQSLTDLETVLAQEMAALPSSQTQALKISLEQDEPEPKTATISLPQDVLNPSTLVGRKCEWALLESAWNSGKNIVIRGEPGVGKSRLIQDFLNSKTDFDLIEGRPGDTGVPLSAWSRTLRQLTATQPKLEIPNWAKLELARLIPEFSDSTPPPMSSETDKLRFFEALFSITQWRFSQGLSAIMIDNLQFMDSASFEAAQFNTERARQLGIRTVTAYRTGELLPELEAQIEASASAGTLQIIDLQPLEEDALNELLQNLKLEMPKDLASRLQHSSGGNPLYVLETIRDLLEQDALHGDLEKLPLPKVVRQITAQRLARRSAQAQRVAQVAAVAGTDFSLELAAFALESKALDLHDALCELENAQFLQGERFAHDLLLEAVLAGIGSSIKRFLHRKCAEFLEGRGDPARVAGHWLEGGDQARAVPLLLEAGTQAQTRFEMRTAATIFARTGALLEALGQNQKAFEVYQKQIEAVCNYDLGIANEALVQKLLEMAKTTDQQAIAWTNKAKLLFQRGQGLASERAAQTALEYANPLQDQNFALNALDCLKQAIFIQGGRTDELIDLTHRAQEIALSLGLTDEAAQYDNDIAVLLARQDKLSEALEYHRSSVAAFRHSNNLSLLTHGLINLGATCCDAGHNQEALQTLNEANALLEHMPDDLDTRLHLKVNLLGVLTYSGRYTAALKVVSELKQLARIYPNENSLYIERFRSCLMLHLGAFDKAQVAAHKVLENHALKSGLHIYALIYRACMESVPKALELLDQAEKLLKNTKRPLTLVRLELCRIPFLNGAEGLKLTQQAREVLSKFDHPALNLTASLRTAQCQLRLENIPKALEESQSMMTMFEHTTPELTYRGEILLTHAQILAAADEPEAREHLERSLHWLLETTRDHVPAEYQEGFLNVNPINRAILEMAKSANLEIPDFSKP